MAWQVNIISIYIALLYLILLQNIISILIELHQVKLNLTFI